jgi:hypothetical protein
LIAAQVLSALQYLVGLVPTNPGRQVPATVENAFVWGQVAFPAVLARHLFTIKKNKKIKNKNLYLFVVVLQFPALGSEKMNLQAQGFPTEVDQIVL